LERAVELDGDNLTIRRQARLFAGDHP